MQIKLSFSFFYLPSNILKPNAAAIIGLIVVELSRILIYEK